MKVKVYGQLDADNSLYEAVVAFAEAKGTQELVVVAHQRKPLGARHCQMPGSLTYDLLLDGKVAAARQAASGTISCPLKR